MTRNWTGEFVRTLRSSDPPDVGAVGPQHLGGNEAIITLDFVHRTHVDVFGFYYPRKFTDWFADDWITGNGIIFIGGVSLSVGAGST